MQSWEYRTIQCWKESGFQWSSGVAGTLNSLGEQGWELVAVVETQKNLAEWIFKRAGSQAEMSYGRDRLTEMSEARLA